MGLEVRILGISSCGFMLSWYRIWVAGATSGKIQRVAKPWFRPQDSRTKVNASKIRIQGAGRRVHNAWCRVHGAGFGVRGLLFRVHGSGSKKKSEW